MKNSLKKCIAAALLLTLLLSCLGSANADPGFTLRQGVHFGETEETVYAKETWTPLADGHFFAFEGKITDLPSMVLYTFDDGIIPGDTAERGLKNVLYCVNTVYLEDGSTRYSRRSSFPVLCNLLRMKYGAPLTGGEALACVKEAPIPQIYTLYLSWFASVGVTDFEAISPDYERAVWIVPDEGGDVTIEVQEYRVTQNGEPCYFTLLNYSVYSDFEIEQIQAEFQSQLNTEI
ncbi:MAG: hypothetical protein IJ174_02695 [Clostridia bacterium]|nr:hypothetical protein [Clostridia bacterium]